MRSRSVLGQNSSRRRRNKTWQGAILPLALRVCDQVTEILQRHKTSEVKSAAPQTPRSEQISEHPAALGLESRLAAKICLPGNLHRPFETQGQRACLCYLAARSGGRALDLYGSAVGQDFGDALHHFGGVIAHG
jgi:hypothetical protein